MTWLFVVIDCSNLLTHGFESVCRIQMFRTSVKINGDTVQIIEQTSSLRMKFQPFS